MNNAMKLLSCMALCSLASVGYTAPNATPVIFPKGSYCAGYSGNIHNNKTFSLFLLKNNYLNIHFDPQEVNVRVKNSAGKTIKGYADDDIYVVSSIPKKGTYYVTVTPKSKYRGSWQELKFCADETDI